MSFNGSGLFEINTTGQPVVTGTTISSTVFNDLTDDLATGLTTCITKDGQTTPTANIPMGSNKITGLANGTVATDAAAYGQLSTYGVPGYTTTATAAGTTTLTVSSTFNQYFTGATTQTVVLPVVSTLALGFQFRIVNLSTGSLTVNSSGSNLTATVTAASEITLTCKAITGTDATSWDVKFTGTTAETGTGSNARATSPTLVTPTIGVATATSVNKVAITAPATSATLTIADGKTLTANASLTLAGTDAKTLTVSNSLTLTGTDSSSVNFGTGGTVSYAIAQVVNTQTGAVATGTTIIPTDDSIPQNTEGDEYMTLAITPTNASSTLLIDIVWRGASSVTSNDMVVALFQDTTAGALAAMTAANVNAYSGLNISFRHKMTAGTTSATTFKVRAGFGSAGTTTFNGSGGARTMGGVCASSITITEVLP